MIKLGNTEVVGWEHAIRGRKVIATTVLFSVKDVMIVCPTNLNIGKTVKNAK